MDFTNCPPRSLRQTLAAAQKMTSRWELANNLVALDLLSTVFGFISFGNSYLTQEMKKWTKARVCIYSFQKDCFEIFKHVFGHWICPIVTLLNELQTVEHKPTNKDTVIVVLAVGFQLPDTSQTSVV